MNHTIDPLALWPVARLMRPKTGWPSGPMIHYGLLTQGEYVFTSTPERGEHVCTWDDYWQGLPVWREEIPPMYRDAAHTRLIEALQNPRP